MKYIFTDGSALNNGDKQAKGGFGVVVCEGNSLEECKVIDAYQERAEGTTNNRMELSAILWALENYGDSFPCPIVYSDSMYCVNSLTDWIKGWKKNNWTRFGGKTLENKDLIQRYDELVSQGLSIDLRHIKGHSGNIYNEMANDLATGRLNAEATIDYFKSNFYDCQSYSLWDSLYRRINEQ